MPGATLPERPLQDAFGRTATDLRVSVTDRCDLRCRYCMPADGLAWLPSRTLLTDDEVVRLVRIAVEHLGITRVRFTGGEPLLRPGLAGIVAATSALRTSGGERVETSLTTNGVRLAAQAPTLAEAGLSRVNVSLDSLDPERYAALARRPRLPDVLRGLAAAHEAGLRPVKVNTVVLRDTNEADIVPLADFCLRNGYQLRFIEEMPIGPADGWSPLTMVPAGEILTALAAHFDMQPVARTGSAPATTWSVAASDHHPGGTIGVIASVSVPFCASCDRTRLTADGCLRTCLFSDTESDLRTPLRAGATDGEIAGLWADAHRRKWRGHAIGSSGFQAPGRTMSAIGG